MARLSFRAGKCLAASFSGFLFTYLFFSVLESLPELRGQNWNQPGLRWLYFDFVASRRPWEQGMLGAALTLALACAGEFLPRIQAAPLRLLRWATRVFGRPYALGGLLLLAVSPTALAWIARPEPPPEGSPNVVVLLVDTWRADRTDFLGYERPTWPETSKLVERGVVFERAIAQAPWTKPSVASIFTSLVPSRHGALSHVKIWEDRRFIFLGRNHTTLAECLAAAGYDTFGTSQNANVCEETGLAQGFRDFRLKYNWKLDAEAIIAESERQLQSRDASRPFFSYVHLVDPHYPYQAPAPFLGHWDRSELDLVFSRPELHAFYEGDLSYSDVEMAHFRDAYDEEQLYTDSQVAPFLQSVLDRWPNTIVVLLGDHGDEFMEHGGIGHGHTLYDELTHVPMVVIAPGVEPARVTRQVRLLDVMPTLLELTGSANLAPDVTMGESLVPDLAGQRLADLPAPIETGGDGEPPWHLRGIVMPFEGRRWKLVVHTQPGHPEQDVLKLFDLDADTAEQVDLAAARPEVAAACFAAMKERGWFLRYEELQGGMDRGRLGAGAIRNLEGLGYVSGDEE